MPLTAPVRPPPAEAIELLGGVAALAVGQRIGRVDMMFVVALAGEHGEVLVEEHEVGAFVEPGERPEGMFQFAGQEQGRGVTAGRGAGETDQGQHGIGENVADPGDHADGAAEHDAVDDLGVDADEQVEVGGSGRDVLCRVRQRLAPAELLVADEVGVVGAQLEEQVGACLEAVVRAVVDDARQVRGGTEHAVEVIALRRGGGTS